MYGNYHEDDMSFLYNYRLNEKNVFPKDPMFAQSYVPWQTMNKTFMPNDGLKMGTIFPELVSPYKPMQSVEFINYIKKTNNMEEGCNK